MKEETTITFLAAGAGSFMGWGVYRMYVFKKKPSGITEILQTFPSDASSLEFSLHHAEDPLYNEENIHWLPGRKGKELLSYVPYYAIIRWCRKR